MRDYISEISRSIRENDLAIFCGAGISKHSGFPLANELKRQILEELSMDEKDLSELLNSVFPFEAFMESVSLSGDISRVLHMFEDGKPNTNHILIAKLVRIGYLRTILTTNFDSLIEKALESEGLRQGIDFNTYFTEEHFSRIYLDNLGNKAEIFKIHGSIHDAGSIRTTLAAVAGKTLSDTRSRVIRHLFSTGMHKCVLVLGYSCSDVFDLTPHIQTIGDDLKEVIFVEHWNKEEVEISDIKAKDSSNPFKKFTGKWIRCNTDQIIRQMWNSLLQVIGDNYEYATSQIQWRNYVHDWATDLEEKGEWRGHFIVAFMFERISDYNKAIKYYEKALVAANSIGDEGGQASCHGGLGNANHQMGNYRHAINNHKKALAITIALGSNTGEAACYDNLGNAYSEIGACNEAMEYYEKARVIQVADDRKGSEARSIANLGRLHRRIGDYAKAIEYLGKALQILIETGDKEGESNAHMNLGDAYHTIGDYRKAIKHHEKALATKMLIGDKDGEGACYGSLAIDYDGLELYKEAIEYNDKSLGIAIAVGRRANQARAYGNLANCYVQLEDHKKAIEYNEKALVIQVAIGDRLGEASCYANLCIAYRHFADYKKAIEYNQKAFTIQFAIGNKSGQAICFVNLGNVYRDMREHEKAIDSYLIAQKIFQEIGQTHYLGLVYNNLYRTYEDIGDYESMRKYKEFTDSK